MHNVYIGVEQVITTANYYPTMCKAPFCKESHKKHHCRHCGDYDSNHVKANCPRMAKRCNDPNCRKCKCRARGCVEVHSSHFCRTCKVHDSSHRNKDCPTHKHTNTNKNTNTNTNMYMNTNTNMYSVHGNGHQSLSQCLKFKPRFGVQYYQHTKGTPTTASTVIFFNRRTRKLLFSVEGFGKESGKVSASFGGARDPSDKGAKDAAIRETNEEAGHLNLLNPRLEYIIFHFRCAMYIVSVDGPFLCPKVAPGKEISQVFWEKPQNVRKYIVRHGNSSYSMRHCFRSAWANILCAKIATL